MRQDYVVYKGKRYNSGDKIDILWHTHGCKNARYYTGIFLDCDEEKDEYVVEGPRIEKMLGYTNLESEKGFTFFQNFLKDTGILEELEELGIEDGDTVRMYGLSFDYYKN